MPIDQHSIIAALSTALLIGASRSLGLSDNSTGSAAGGGLVTTIVVAVFLAILAEHSGSYTLSLLEKVVMSTAIGSSVAFQLGAIVRLVSIYREVKPSEVGPSPEERAESVGMGFLVGVAAASAGNLILGLTYYVVVQLLKSG